eukprot:1058367_1
MKLLLMLEKRVFSQNLDVVAVNVLMLQPRNGDDVHSIVHVPESPFWLRRHGSPFSGRYCIASAQHVRGDQTERYTSQSENSDPQDQFCPCVSPSSTHIQFGNRAPQNNILFRCHSASAALDIVQGHILALHLRSLIQRYDPGETLRPSGNVSAGLFALKNL